MTLINELENYHKLIMMLELAGLFHDTGKLDSQFIDYRKKWQGGKDLVDTHGDNFFDKDNLFSGFNNLTGLFGKSLSEICGCDLAKSISLSDVSMKRIIHEHIEPKHDLSKMIKCADSFDSAYDRNNPLYAAEQQKNGEKTYASSVVGYETAISVDSLDDARKKLYQNLNTIFPDYLINFGYDKRQQIFKAAEEAFKQTVTDTCRSANDVSLWQHSYVTAALFKILFTHYLIYNEIIKEVNSIRFCILGVGWDGLSFISKGHKIGDIVGRKQAVSDLKQAIKKLVEFDYPIGSNIYDDDNGIYFIIPSMKEGSNEYKDLLETHLQDKVFYLSNDLTEGEIQPVVDYESVCNTHFIMDIVRVIQQLKQKIKYPYYANSSSWISQWKKDGKEVVCNVCLKRPVEEEEKKTVCKWCKDRRQKSRLNRKEQEAIFTNEIADENGRLALITAKFGLDKWLNGEMLWTLFVKNYHIMKEAFTTLGQIKDFEAIDTPRKEGIKKYLTCIDSFKYTYEKIIQHINMIDEFNNLNNSDKEFVKNIFFLFSHKYEPSEPSTTWEELKEWLGEMNKFFGLFGRNIDLYNYLLTKNHTPSRLLRLWNETRDFFNDFLNFPNIMEHLPEFKRIEIQLESSAKSSLKIERAVYEAVFSHSNERIELFREGEKVFAVTRKNITKLRPEWENSEITITLASEFEKQGSPEKIKTKIISLSCDDTSLRPFRTITVSPDLFMALVPADSVLEISQIMYKEYLKRFGKVIGRLPFSVGNIFFNKHTPMFVVLDAGRRMANNFEKLHKDEISQKVKEKKEENNNTIITFDNNSSWEIYDKLGDGMPDYYHPYLFVEKNDSNPPEKRDTYFKALNRDIVHFSEISPGDELKIYPNFYDYEFLDSTIRRFDLYAGEKGKRPHIHFGSEGTCPYPLEMLNQIVDLWNTVTNISGLTDTKLRNIESLWLTKLKEWDVDLARKDSSNFQEWRQLIESTLTKEFAPEVYELLKESIYSGLFFDCLELNLRILKKKVKKE